MGEAPDKQTERGEWGARKGGEERERERRRRRKCDKESHTNSSQQIMII